MHARLRSPLTWLAALAIGSAATAAPLVWAAEIIPPKEVSGTIRWLYDYQEAKRLARESGKPLFVVFRCER